MITDEQIAAINKRCADEWRGNAYEFVSPDAKLSEADYAVEILLQAITERDTEIAGVRKAYAAQTAALHDISQTALKWGNEAERLAGELAEQSVKKSEHIGELITERDEYMTMMQDARRELADLRKPVAVQRNETVESIRSRRIQPGNAVLAGSAAHEVLILLSAYDTLAQDCSRYANAHAVLVADLEAQKLANEGLREGMQNLAAKLVDAEERERSLLEQIRGFEKSQRAEGERAGAMLRDALVSGERERQLREPLECAETAMHRHWMHGRRVDFGAVINKARDALAASPAPVESEDTLDAKRYRRLQILGCSPYAAAMPGTVLRFSNLDRFLDDDIRAHASRGEAAPVSGNCSLFPGETISRCSDYPACRCGQALAPVESTAHTDDIAVDKFAAAMKLKLAQKRAEGYLGCMETMWCLMEEHVYRGDPIDVGNFNFAMMLWNREQSEGDHEGKGNG